MFLRVFVYVLIAGNLPYKRGDFATGGPNIDSAEVGWLSGFNLIEIGGVDDGIPRWIIDSLHNAGCRILGYEWMPAGYHYTDGSPDDSFMVWVYENRDTLTLNPSGPFPHCEQYGWCEDYYYDMALQGLVSHRVDYILTTFGNAGFDGIFFDWASGNFIYEDEYTPMRDTFASRHPGVEYPSTVENFYRSLKNADSSFIIMTNQGFREHPYILPVTDYDMTESYATSDDYFGEILYVEGMGLVEIPRTVYYPVSDDYMNGHVEDQIYYLNVLKSMADSSAGEGFKGFVYMNYAAPRFVPTGDTAGGYPVYRAQTPRNAIYFGYAIPRLLNYMVYTEVPWDHRLERDSIYFLDLGYPLGDSYESQGNHVYVRYYSQGFVVVGEWQDTTVVHLESPHIPSSVPFYDAYRRIWDTTGAGSVDFTVIPEYDPLTGRMAPSGRVFLYDIPSIRIDEGMGDYHGFRVRYSAGRIFLEPSSQSIESFAIFDVSGRLVQRGRVRGEVSLSDYAGSGIYFIRVSGRGGRQIGVQKVLIVR